MPHTEVHDWQESSGLELEVYYNPCMVEAGNSVGGRIVVVVVLLLVLVVFVLVLLLLVVVVVVVLLTP